MPHKVNLTELCSSSAAVVRHKLNLPSCVVTQLPLCHKVSPPRCEARRRLFILTCDIFGTGQTNIYLFIYLITFTIITILKKTRGKKYI